MPGKVVGAEFEAFYRKHYDMVYKICYMYLKNSYDAEDCTEDVFIKVFKGEYEFMGAEQEKAWLSVTAINQCKNRLKHWWNKRVTYDEVDETALAVSPENHDSTLDAVRALPTKYKDVIYMHYYMGMSSEDIAKMLKKPSSTVRSLLFHAKKKLEIEIGGIE